MIFHHATGDRHPTHLHKFIKRYWFELSFFLSSVTFNFSCVRFWYKHLITSSINVSITSNFSQVRFWYKKFITSNATGSTHPLIKFSVNLNFFHVRFWYQYIIISNVIHISQENVTKKNKTSTPWTLLVQSSSACNFTNKSTSWTLLVQPPLYAYGGWSRCFPLVYPFAFPPSCKPQHTSLSHTYRFSHHRHH